ncbi:3-deoxy-7-phosphoheptulonate synthase [Vibrio lentus]|uniref:Phospho-2-dehydro-3-deoxyheptonate aldolase n=1 Tax=Vibrio lentus TaxID=136468 RepID=A0A2N7BT14_9VIBR|nr:3-deoxy-7-phosphoheptulonate synthase [Vibrio lentus]PME54319.1 3-deoxy-7-phosphoheptulonate synthase [Vibrio lentus]PME62907.1 3-deoxy-7-phosphoheptulonate synthase [Vibrio lentus]PME77619.1 3-deoxy-7-phosphoheptulonate synthase [Vibrio lentus]PMG76719.1 3-deoxy-7-phosphoheptulonate synthase [Vibrio lentus]PMH92310.1 3-deoxy-7-phosphoheptulonate synthase [Vibrio lentus]
MNQHDGQCLTNLPIPKELISEIKVSRQVTSHINDSRKTIKNILSGKDHRLLVVIGPCSVHDEEACLDYANRLQSINKQYQESLFVVMRTYLEKPRTTIGWKGFISDPNLDGSHDYVDGLYRSRSLLYKINQMGLATATEILDPYLYSYYSDLICWAAIGARTTESQPHREIVSALPYAVGFKNSTDGNIQVAMDAIQTAKYSHTTCSLNYSGQLSLMCSAGNPYGHVILRGGKQPNYYQSDVQKVHAKLREQGINPCVMVDLSHGNSQRNHKQQLVVAESVCLQIENGSTAILGVMAESFIKGGNQPLSHQLNYGQSITDACLSWQDTLGLLDRLHAAMLVKYRVSRGWSFSAERWAS